MVLERKLGLFFSFEAGVRFGTDVFSSLGAKPTHLLNGPEGSCSVFWFVYPLFIAPPVCVYFYM